ncbi:armadillo repeat containing 1, like isoform X2 [Callorhinchus milii]|uniref:Armadillo repeat-containing protein 1 n=2 Tax=Callorhinchus milii TaxID=7868 RepID=V9L1H3_CALMI|nr:armadillo repeat containing 1, like isoform X2 [Callorhinchus milii]XP_042189528.1 armadillo repeat containing 1, like isoform X2 [Callorhinchus milii]XP_042189529.1 armadillo repeat containing 1, like isoform X2 [Callorhinchus milii]XP_042189530.1 armadillo repeat containing 1, like isoform X2 [Callorhinchus milii]|eukprot:gi/632951280/ref/XP_007891202.1/ PREDICTED: armadillo repeat-containing protein 1-like [Callorhinchus milii]
MDALSVVIQLRDLASEPQNREAIVKDQGCVPGLVLFLTHHNPQVSFCALQALRYLAECPSNREIMKNELGMMVCLENLCERDHVLEDARILAVEIYDQLKKPLRIDSLNMKTTKQIQTQFFINSTNKKAKTVTLQIEGLHNMDHRSICEEALLRVKGVISFTFQMTLQRCVIRICSDLKTECLASAIAATNVLQAHQVIKNESGEEIVISLNSHNAKVEEKNVDLPDYLPEDESVKNDHKAVSRAGTKGNTVTWLNAAANFLTKTFYW